MNVYQFIRLKRQNKENFLRGIKFIVDGILPQIKCVFVAIDSKWVVTCLELQRDIKEHTGKTIVVCQTDETDPFKGLKLIKKAQTAV